MGNVAGHNDSLMQAALSSGFAGGIAEVVWIAAYCAGGQQSATQVAREVTAAVLPALAADAYAPALGILVHLALSVLLALGFLLAFSRTFLLRSQSRLRLLFGSVAVLVIVWGFNFGILLPVLHPPFVALLPHGVTLASKIFYAFAMAAVLCSREARWVRVPASVPRLRRLEL